MRWRATMCYARISLSRARKALRIKDAGDRRVARKRDKYWKPAGKRQADGRYGVGGGKAERAARFASTLGPGRKTLQGRQTRRNAEGDRPVALLKVVAKC